MAGSLLIPMSVTAKVVTNPIPVPSLTGAPFNRDSSLEKGIHVHWALPDALTNARVLNNITDPTDPKSSHPVLFPGVPDLWLVVRLNPLPASIPANFKRAWNAWVVDSRAQTPPKPLDQWQPPNTPAKATVHTAAGLLTSAASIKFGGWGVYDKKAPFDIASAAYYPTARTRFGFYDSLQGLAAQGKVSYIVCGWYSNRDQDPLYNAPNRHDLLERWNMTGYARSETIFELMSAVAIDPSAVIQSWKPTSLKVKDAGAPTGRRLDVAQRAATRGGVREQRAQMLNNLNQSINLASASIKDVAPVMAAQRGPTEILCHGSVLEVPLAGAAAPPPIKTEQIHLFPSVNRAMAAIAAAKADGQTIDQVEMLLNNADQQTGSMAGVIDLPGFAHARNFQGVPGAPIRYARIEVKPVFLFPLVSGFDSIPQVAPGGRKVSGHWPNAEFRMAKMHPETTTAEISTGPIQKFPVKPTGPTPDELNSWIGGLMEAFRKAIKDAADKGTPIDQRLIRVQDHRSDAQPVSIGRSLDGKGPEQAGYWLEVPSDITNVKDLKPADLKRLTEFYMGAWTAEVQLPDAGSLYEIPGPQWYHPWSPQIVINGAGRSYRFGEDNRFEPGRVLRVRVSGETMSALRVGSLRAVTGRELLANGTPLSGTSGLPPEVRSLVEEAMLHDSDCGGVMAAQGVGTQPVFQRAIQANWLVRDPELSDADRSALGAIQGIGVTPSPIAITPWKDPTDPLFVDVKYAHPFSSLEQDWTLKPDFVDLTPNNPAATQPTLPDHVKNFPAGERARLTATICKVLDSSLVSKITVDPNGLLAKAQAPPPNVDEDTYTKIDLLSAALTQFDNNVFAAGLRQRSGALRLNHLDVVDVYGVARHWDSPTKPDESPAGDDKLSYWTQLTPRLPYWSRLQHRFIAAKPGKDDTSLLEPVICGFLLPDFVEHSIEVLDGEGNTIGEIRSAHPQLPQPAAVVNGLKVEFHVHPWLNRPDDVNTIENETLRSVVAGLAAQSRDIPAKTPKNATATFESGLTAFLRVIDTVRSTLDPTVKNPDRSLHLLGEPIVVVKTLLSIEATGPRNREQIASVPPAIPGTLPSVHVRIGDVTRPDDGVLGRFIPGATPEDSGFAAVSLEAVTHAVVNALAEGVETLQRAADDKFLLKQSSELGIAVGGPPVPLTILMDARGGIYATSGVLPRKKITLQREQLDAALARIEASFRTGPILAVNTKGVEKAAIPAIDMQGFKTSFLRQKADATFQELPVPATVPLGELPQDRVMVSGGRLRVTRQKDKEP